MRKKMKMMQKRKGWLALASQPLIYASKYLQAFKAAAAPSAIAVAT